MGKQQIRLLIVEDDVVDRMACRRALAQHADYDFILYEAETGRQGLQLASAQPPDCILLDYHLPDLDGIEFLKELRGEMEEIPVPVMMLTGADNAAVAVEAMKRGAKDYLVKDLERQYLDLLPAVIERVLREQALIAEKKRAEDMLCRAEAKYRTLVEQIPAITYIAAVDDPGSSLYISPQVAVLGYTPEEWLAEPGIHFKLIHRDDLPRVNADISHARASGRPLRSEYRMVTRNGRTLWVRDEATVVLGEHGEALFLQGILLDITEMKTVEEELRQHRYRLEELVAKRTAMLESANASLRQEIAERRQVEKELFEEKEFAQVTLASIVDAVITADSDGKVGYMNPVAEQLTGYSLSESLGQPIARILPILDEASREPVRDIVGQCLLQGGSTSQCGYLLVRYNGPEYAVDLRAAPISNKEGKVMGVVIVFHDVTQQRKLSQQISFQATHDMLTGLPNRAEFEQRLARVLASARTEKCEHALCYLDLDQFKVVNDTCGHAAGDELLRQVSSLLHAKMRQRDTLARLGGDEFGILLEHCPPEQAWRIASELCEAVHDFRFIWHDKVFNIGISIGVVALTQQTEGASEAMSAADAACYIAKEKGRNRVHVFQPDDADFAERRVQMQWVSRITKALDEDSFKLCYQPITPLTPGGPCNRPHYEILLRLVDENSRLVEPGAFIPAAERYGLMPAIDRWVLRHAIANLALRPGQDTGADTPIFAVNLSSASFNDDSLVGFIRGLLEKYRVSPRSLCLEVTETTAMANLPRTVQLMNDLKETGCCFALDNFGRGMSSFTYIKKLPVDFIKINGDFVRSIVKDDVDRAMANAINHVAHVMAIQTVAECAETDAILGILKQLGIDHAQGYAIAAPRPLEELQSGGAQAPA